jgi:acyl-CoA reductase-like NAD-dependent aldehyde dehydrogenase
VPHLLKGESLEGVARGVDVELVRQPVGVVAAITPFNFPAMIPLWFLPFAIACGNTVVLKPSERDPLASERIVSLVAELDEIPDGVVNLVHGGREVVDGLCDHPEVDAVSFVGSAAVARHVYARAAGNGKRVRGRREAETCPLIDAAARERVEAESTPPSATASSCSFDGRIGGGAAGAELHPTVVDLGPAAREFRATVEAGMLGVNVGVAAPVAWFPFAGWKDSMAGDLHANGTDAIEFYTRKKVVTSRW